MINPTKIEKVLPWTEGYRSNESNSLTYSSTTSNTWSGFISLISFGKYSRSWAPNFKLENHLSHFRISTHKNHLIDLRNDFVNISILFLALSFFSSFSFPKSWYKSSILTFNSSNNIFLKFPLPAFGLDSKLYSLEDSSHLVKLKAGLIISSSFVLRGDDEGDQEIWTGVTPPTIWWFSQLIVGKISESFGSESAILWLSTL